MLERCATNLEALSNSLASKSLPGEVTLPPLAEWLQAKGLEEITPALVDWDLRLLLDMVGEATSAEFDADFAEEIPSKPKRRKLFHSLRHEFNLHSK